MKKREILLIKRSDSGVWALLGGSMDNGESISQCCLWEIKEETNIEPTIEKLVGVYTSLGFIFEFRDGRIWQNFVVAFLCRCLNDQNIAIDHESVKYKWISEKN